MHTASMIYCMHRKMQIRHFFFPPYVVPQSAAAAIPERLSDGREHEPLNRAAGSNPGVLIVITIYLFALRRNTGRFAILDKKMICDMINT